MIATTWCGSRVEVNGRFWLWLLGWIRGGWTLRAFRARREARRYRASREFFIDEVLYIWQQTLALQPQLGDEYKIAHEWLTKTYTADELKEPAGEDLS